MSILKLLTAATAGSMIYDYAKKEGFIPISLMSFSSSTSDLLKEFEYENWKSEINNYNSPLFKVQNVGDGALTVGWGITNYKNALFSSQNKITKIGQTFSLSQLQTMYKAVLDQNTLLLKDRLKGLSVPQGVFDAIFSAFYNAENGLFFKNGNETNFWKYVKNEDWENARMQFDFWKSGGKVLKGLVIRRMQEHAIWIGKEPKSRQEYSQYWEQFRDTKNETLL